MKRRILILSSALLLVFSANQTVYGQSENNATEEEKFKFNLGFGAGFTTGYGLAFRYMPKKFGVQANVGPYFDEDTERYSLGLTFLYNIVESRRANLYLYQGNHYYYNTYLDFIYAPKQPNQQEPYEVKRQESYLNSGVGLGAEIILAERLSLNFMAGYAFYRNFRSLNLTGETAFFFKF